MVPPLSKLPTASHAEADVHEMPVSWPPPGSGMVSTVHVLPLRLSASSPVALPTAMQDVVEVQDTALNCQTDAPEGRRGVLLQPARRSWLRYHQDGGHRQRRRHCKPFHCDRHSPGVRWSGAVGALPR